MSNKTLRLRRLDSEEVEETDGATTVRLTHSSLQDEESLRSHEDGWSACLDNLERALGTARPGG